MTPEEGPLAHLLRLMRDYWAIENGLHYRRDKTLQEDATRMTDPIINNLVIALTRQDGFTSLPAARRYYNTHLPAALKLLLSGFSKM